MAFLSGKIGNLSPPAKNGTSKPNGENFLNFHLSPPAVGYAQLNPGNDDSVVLPGKALILGTTLLSSGLIDPPDRPEQSTTADGSGDPEALPSDLLRLAGAEGGFAFVFWEQAKAVLWLGTEYGFKPFYYYYRDGELAFSTDLDRLVRNASRKFEVNYSVFSQYLCLRHPFGDETLFREINRLPQGVFLRYSVPADRLERVPYFDYRSFQPDLSITSQQVLAEGPARFTAALKRQVGRTQKVVLPLSGGYDSRMIACGLHRLGIELLTYTTHKDYRYTTDTMAAAEVGKLLGTTHHDIALPNNYFTLFHQRKCGMVNFETSYHSWIVNLLSILPKEPFPCFDGLGGDACLGGSEITPEFWGLWRREKYEQFAKEYFRWYKTTFGSLVAKAYLREIKALARQQINAEIRRIKGNPNGLIYLGLRNFTRRAIALSTFGILGHERPIRTPFFDHQFFEWSMTIPVRLKVKTIIYRQLFKDYSGRTAVVPNTHQRPNDSRYFQKTSAIWPKRVNRRYLGHMINQLTPFLPEFVNPNLKEMLDKKDSSVMHRDVLFALADLAYWFVTYQNNLTIRGWMK